MSGYIGVDLDGTLAFYDGWRGATHVGEPIRPMVKRVKQWLKAGVEVRIVTARASHKHDLAEVIAAIDTWCLKHIGQKLAVTCEKTFGLIELWDDRAVQVIPNTGRRADGKDDE